jgi:integrator complex subunit 11
MRKVTQEHKGDSNVFTSLNIKDCMKKVTAINLHHVIEIEADFEIKAYCTGHVLGAAMFHVRVGERSIVCTVREKQELFCVVVRCPIEFCCEK